MQSKYPELGWSGGSLKEDSCDVDWKYFLYLARVDGSSAIFGVMVFVDVLELALVGSMMCGNYDEIKSDSWYGSDYIDALI